MTAGRRKNQQLDIFEVLPQAIEKFRKTLIDPFFGNGQDPESTLPLRSEIYTGEQLAQHARVLAARHITSSRLSQEQLLRRLADNENILLQVHASLTESVKKNNRIVPAAEWLLDNFYLIEEQIYTAKKHLPKGYSKGLPRLEKGASAGLPRVYDIAVEIISHSDGHVNLDGLINFVKAYQETSYLNLGELWAIPIMLRLALLENLRRLSIQISIDIANKSLADYWANQFIDVAENEPTNLILVIADMARSKPPIESSFVAELTRRIQEQGSLLSLVSSWLEQVLLENGFSSAEMIQQENQKQAADQVSISNSISSLRFLEVTDWREFVEVTSNVDEILAGDPAGIYKAMDFETRDDYRHAVEKIAKYSKLQEQAVAKIALQFAQTAAERGAVLKENHVGYYLVDAGKKATIRETGMKKPFNLKLHDIIYRAPLFFYAGAILLVTGIIAWYLVSGPGAWVSTGVKATLAVFIITAASQFANSFVNWLITVLARPALLPRMNFSKGVPGDFKTVIVVPAMLNSAAGIAELTENLEVRFLANRDKNFRFALLTDFADADEETQEDDAPLLSITKQLIDDLNDKYHQDTHDSFFLLHRHRKWNPREGKWMGEERKRGKLADLNHFLQTGDTSAYKTIIGRTDSLHDIKFVITLDADTQLPREAAWKLVATLAHPLNRAVYDEKKQRVTSGYSILQPRVSNSLPVNNASVYMKIHGNDAGTDPYTKATSDVYQDLFEEGSFIGKGIYDVAAFEQALKNKLPDNRILSHDLLEGAYARSGLVTDVQFYEEYPSSYLTDMKRRHRWIRGDWQIINWVFGVVPGPGKKLYNNPVSRLSKWKIADNIRRSLVPLALLSLLFYGWLISSAPFVWTVFVIAIMFAPLTISLTVQAFRKPDDVILRQHIFYTIRCFREAYTRLAIDFMCLPYEVLLTLDAILKTLWRILISKKHLLQWNPYHNTNTDTATLGETYRRMWISAVLSIGLLGFLAWHEPWAMAKTFPILALWFIAPFIVWVVSKPKKQVTEGISMKEEIYLRQVARKIWLFFETFVSREDNWLPPDNYQEQPVERIAHRTSPTNMGLSLLSNLTALDLGYIGIGKVCELTTNALGTFDRMERYRGHFYNWYDTITLAPLNPRYISTVDSGNLVGNLVTLRQGLIGLADAGIIAERDFNGLLDECRLLMETGTIEELKDWMQQVSKDYPVFLEQPAVHLDFIKELQQSFNQLSVPATGDGADWHQRIVLHLQAMQAEMDTLIAWLTPDHVPEYLRERIPVLNGIPSLNELQSIGKEVLMIINQSVDEELAKHELRITDRYRSLVLESNRRVKERLLTLRQLAERCERYADVEYDFLFDSVQNLFAIGYNVDEHRRDNSYYDLLASEARLATFVAIAQGKITQQAWFALGRQLTNIGTTPILLSWSGSMFEYLMPLLVMPSYENTLLHQTTKAVVQKQIDYAKRHGIPWGISESGYNTVDSQMNYQYRAFGVPGLGFKRGLGEDLVISPYSTVMSLMVAPADASSNLQQLKKLGFEGRYGFYEAVDYTTVRLLRKQDYAIIQSFMAHHQGMSLLSISHLVCQQPMQKRFEADVQVKSALLLLQERIPRVTTFYSPSVHEADTSITAKDNGGMRVLDTADTTIPEVQLLSNGRYHVAVTNAGGGYSRWRNIALTRWREDSTSDDWGTFCFIRDMENDVAWSASFQPTLQEADAYEAVFSQGRAEFRRRDHSIESHTEIVVSPEDDIELRRVHITNRSRKKRTIEITSYSEVVLAPAIADELHPAFSNLFIQTEINEQRNTIFCTRRPRSDDEHNPWMFHLMKVHEAEIISVTYETDRDKFIGRGRTIHNAAAMEKDAAMSGSQGSVLDPVVAIRYKIVLEPYASTIVDMITGIAETKEISTSLVEKYQDRHLINRVLELAWTHSQVILRQINASEPDAQLYARLASSIIYANASLRADPSIIVRNQKGQPGLWSYAISGDLPIVLVQIEDVANIDLVRKLVQAHAYWRLKGLIVDLVIWNEDHGGYRQDLQNQILGLLSTGMAGDVRDKPGGIFVRSSEQIPNEDRILFQSIAHIVLADRWGKLEEQIKSRVRFRTAAPYFAPDKNLPNERAPEPQLPMPPLQFFNGYGGFSQDGREYVINISPDKPTPAPWINVLANPDFGSIVSESGGSYTWLTNAHEYRLTPWNNDPVTDLKGEAFFLRDEESGHFWSPTPLPRPGNANYITRHGFGYSIFHYREDGLETEMCVYTDKDAPVKFMVLKVRNRSGRRRRVSVTGYVEWVLGDLRSKTLRHVITEMDTRTGAVFARNVYHSEMGGSVAFFDVDDPNKSYTTDRAEFLGRNGTIANPDAMKRKRLSGKSGAALDPCAAIQVVFDLAEDEEHQVVYRLGAGKSRQEALDLIQAYAGTLAATTALDKLKDYWNNTLNAVHIETPDAATNLLTNGWLNYQALACRYWARSGFYQSGGAFGFRDQLQDVLSLLHTKPDTARQQLLICASRQFKEGDVQHWWHPPAGRGVRTTCSDDFLWLPFVAYRYLRTTGDMALLDETSHFLEGRLLNAGEESYFDLPIQSDKKASFYEHCVKAVEHGLRFGEHGLPLMGSGDWNDGMDKVGQHGKGESIWLAFFLYDVLINFAPIAESKNDTAFAAKCRTEAATLKENINKHAWDGEWYRRGYFDDGSPLGSRENEECKIDSIAQSWSVLSGGGDEERTAQALVSAEKYLVREKGQYIQLFDPPFDKSTMNPGYIKGYVPGVRENGGQYTHAAIWLVMAFAAKKDREKTWKLLQMINPLNHGNTKDAIELYKVEPYIMAADIYGVEHHRGRGGWTWYTGSAGWMYQLVLESFIGLKRRGNELTFEPCFPEDWTSVRVNYRFGKTMYRIELLKRGKNGEPIKLVDDGGTHEIAFEFTS